MNIEFDGLEILLGSLLREHSKEPAGYGLFCELDRRYVSNKLEQAAQEMLKHKGLKVTAMPMRDSYEFRIIRANGPGAL